ncbi:MAG: two-component system, OmpR family, response regulator MprA [Thermoleophilaceae bacterium]|nr:two-component system, OmpR family, response regulator MprA [Thermoleophilaceae bacterium]
MAHASILVVDDDASLRRMLDRTLTAEGFEVETAADGGGALVAVERSVPEVIVLDVGLPGLDGLTVCRRLRAKGIGVPIIMLTARDAVPDRVAGLESGADDYLVKPFATEELVARVRALTRRGHGESDELAVTGLTLDSAARIAVRDGRRIELTERETALLELLMRHPKQVISREDAIDSLWAGAATSNLVDRYVGRLREKLPGPDIIRTVRGVGFMLDV